MTSCECTPTEFPFVCQRHGCRKTEHWWHLCRTHSGYFGSWENGDGPGQVVLDEPGPIRKGANFAKAVVRHAANRRRHVSAEVLEARIAVCRICPALDRERMVCTEKKCGCKVKKKARWESERCPVGKWPKAEDPSDADERIHETSRNDGNQT